MDIFKAIEERLSYRGAFTDEPIPREDLIKIVKAGLQAPSGKNAQTTEFVVVDDPGKIAQIQDLHPTNKAMRQAKAYIACVVDLLPEAIYEGHSFQVEDCAAAVENMLLVVTALGYGTVWIDGWLRLQNRSRIIGEWLGVPEDKQIRVLLPLGKPAEEIPRRKKKRFAERAWFNSYQGG